MQKIGHFTSLCKSKARTSAIQEAEAPSGDLGGIATAFMSLEANDGSQQTLPSTPIEIPPILSHMRLSGPVTSLPLPHYVHDTVRGWHQTRPRNSPTITAKFSLDKQSYSELGLNLPRHKQSHNNPGKSVEKPSICDTRRPFHYWKI